MTRFNDHPPAPDYAEPWQNLHELGQLWELVASRSHATVLEIGSLFGGTLWHWLHLPHVEEVVSIDLVTDYEPIRAGVLEARRHWPTWAEDAGVELTIVEADSSSVVEMFAGSSFGFAFIDGDHSYEGVRADWLNYSPLVAPGGLIAFHDTWPNFDRHEPGVVRWVDELRHHLPSIEWTDPDGVGIAAFELPEDR